MEVKNKMKIDTCAKALAGLSALAMMSGGISFAQDRDDAVEYEFAFAYEAGETADERQARLEDEVAEYCDGMDSSYYCEEEITDAVNDQMSDDDAERYASN